MERQPPTPTSARWSSATSTPVSSTACAPSSTTSTTERVADSLQPLDTRRSSTTSRSGGMSGLTRIRFSTRAITSRRTSSSPSRTTTLCCTTSPRARRRAPIQAPTSTRTITTRSWSPTTRIWRLRRGTPSTHSPTTSSTGRWGKRATRTHCSTTATTWAFTTTSAAAARTPSRTSCSAAVSRDGRRPRRTPI